MQSPPDALTPLNGDILLELFEVLRPKKCLRSLSSTCRWLREASSPILFRSCYQLLGEIPWNRTTYEILPSTLWSHVRCRILQLSCFCPAYSQKDPGVVDPLLCDAFSTIDAALPALHQLTTLHLRPQYIDVHGISWNNIRTILSLPHLRHLRIDRFYVCPELLACDNLDDATVAPLATFHYTMPHYRQPWSFPSELATLDTLIRKLHTSLENLMLPVESAPIQTIASLHWPRLREFTLRGERWSDPTTPIVAFFTSMPSLQSLALELSEPEDVGAGVIWPKGLPATLPWPNLESLRVSHPDPADEIYTHLPSSLRTLSLRSWPHECIRIYDERRRHLRPSWRQGYRRRWWSYPLSTPRNLAQVLQKCELPLLRNLELEYRGGEQEPELLQLVAVQFPHLTTLEIHRFRSERSDDAAVDSQKL
ncbi:hypothetical protein LXA43DRAFT_360977 [Ganoderma leucocontextum]|nr:hypothetical protein LXA43DRAFT_360977 [Ganoderma leucocontextum]